jgi:hypothetical protein
MVNLMSTSRLWANSCSDGWLSVRGDLSDALFLYVSYNTLYQIKGVV